MVPAVHAGVSDSITLVAAVLEPRRVVGRPSTVSADLRIHVGYDVPVAVPVVVVVVGGPWCPSSSTAGGGSDLKPGRFG